MTTATKIIIQAIPILGYYIAFLLFKQLIYEKIIHKEERTKYKKLVKEDLAWFFVPIISAVGFLLFAFNGGIPKRPLLLFCFILKCFFLFVQLLLAVIVFPILFDHINKLKRLD